MPKKAHQLKCSTTFFPAIWDNSKPFEVRKMDRDYEEGDTLLLDEYDPVHGYTGRVARRKVTYILTHEMFPVGVPPGYAVMGLEFAHNNDRGAVEPPAVSDEQRAKDNAFDDGVKRSMEAYNRTSGGDPDPDILYSMSDLIKSSALKGVMEGWVKDITS